MQDIKEFGWDSEQEYNDFADKCVTKLNLLVNKNPASSQNIIKEIDSIPPTKENALNVLNKIEAPLEDD